LGEGGLVPLAPPPRDDLGRAAPLVEGSTARGRSPALA